MIDIQAMFKEEFAAAMTEEQIRPLVKEKVEALVTGMIEESLSRWGNFADSLKNKVKQEVGVSLESISFKEYNALILQELQLHIANMQQEQAKAMAIEFSNTVLASVPEMVKFSEMVEIIAEHFKNDHPLSEYAGLEFSFHVDKRDSMAWIYFDSEPAQRMYGCKYVVVLTTIDDTDDWVLHDVRIADREMIKGFFTKLESINKYLFGLACAKPKFKFDIEPDEVDSELLTYERECHC